MWLALWVLIAWILHRFTDSDAVVADAFITSSSIAATILLARKLTANWLIWLAVNVVSTLLFIANTINIAADLAAMGVGPGEAYVALGVPPHVTAADVLALPSSAEGLPQVLVQAARSDLPFVAFDVDGVAAVSASGL